MYYSYVRGLAVNLIHWVHCHFVFYDEKNRLNDFTSMVRQYLHRQVRTIILYKHNAEQGHYRGVPNCTEEALRCQATLLFSPHFAGEFQGFSLSLMEDEETLSWEGEYTPERRAKRLDFEGTIQYTVCLLVSLGLFLFTTAFNPAFLSALPIVLAEMDSPFISCRTLEA